ncbi:hypothetical protein C7S15_7388 [Burkholderia cepacia]|nr:hypothetical protein [Burkholderia cepacia]
MRDWHAQQNAGNAWRRKSPRVFCMGLAKTGGTPARRRARVR